MTSTVMIALTPFNAETGGTRVIPGTHKNPAFPDPFAPHEEAFNVEVQSGSHATDVTVCSQGQDRRIQWRELFNFRTR